LVVYRYMIRPEDPGNPAAALAIAHARNALAGSQTLADHELLLTGSIEAISDSAARLELERALAAIKPPQVKLVVIGVYC
jgi:hypothetical protein